MKLLVPPVERAADDLSSDREGLRLGTGLRVTFGALLWALEPGLSTDLRLIPDDGQHHKGLAGAQVEGAFIRRCCKLKSRLNSDALDELPHHHNVLTRAEKDSTLGCTILDKIKVEEKLTLTCLIDGLDRDIVATTRWATCCMEQSPARCKQDDLPRESHAASLASQGSTQSPGLSQPWVSLDRGLNGRAA